ncbi:hypothetical protein KPATCC21470_0154 [Kitasatospora purpeofusca]
MDDLLEERWAGRQRSARELERVEGIDQVVACIDELSFFSREERLTTHPGPILTAAFDAVRNSDLKYLRRGLRMRTILHARSARHTPPCPCAISPALPALHPVRGATVQEPSGRSRSPASGEPAVPDQRVLPAHRHAASGQALMTMLRRKISRTEVPKVSRAADPSRARVLLITTG